MVNIFKTKKLSVKPIAGAQVFYIKDDAEFFFCVKLSASASCRILQVIAVVDDTGDIASRVCDLEFTGALVCILQVDQQMQPALHVKCFIDVIDMVCFYPKRGGTGGIDRTAFHDLHMSRTTEGECTRTFFWKKKNFLIVCSRFLGIPARKNTFQIIQIQNRALQSVFSCDDAIIGDLRLLRKNE